jgi:hypothetical protein
VRFAHRKYSLGVMFDTVLIAGGLLAVWGSLVAVAVGATLRGITE